MAWVFNHAPTTDGTNQLVALAIADHADEEGYCYPSIERLARRARLSERTVRRSVESLIALSVIEVVRGGHVVRGRFVRSNLYRLSMRKGGLGERGLCDRGNPTTVTESTSTLSQSPPNHHLNHHVHKSLYTRARSKQHRNCHPLFCCFEDPSTFCLVATHVEELIRKMPSRVDPSRTLSVFAAFVRQVKSSNPDLVADANGFRFGIQLWDLFRASTDCDALCAP